MQKNFVRLFAVLQIACVNSLAFAQGNYYTPNGYSSKYDEALAKYQALEAAEASIKRTIESNQNITLLIVVGGVIAAALIAAAIFFRGSKSMKWVWTMMGMGD